MCQACFSGLPVVHLTPGEYASLVEFDPDVVYSLPPGMVRDEDGRLVPVSW